jgi:hypothetical protein
VIEVYFLLFDVVDHLSMMNEVKDVEQIDSLVVVNYVVQVKLNICKELFEVLVWLV